MWGAFAAAWPRIRSDLGLGYAEVGLLLALPPLLGCVLELPIFLLGEGERRRAFVRAGGVALAVSLLGVAGAGSLVPLLLALVLANPASGAFVALSQATLSELDPARAEANMARWALAGSVGMLAGPLALAAAALAGAGWRELYLVFAALAGALVCATWRLEAGAFEATADAPERVGAALVRAAREALAELRRAAVVRWLALLQLADLLLDVFHAYLALYFVDVAGMGAAGAALAVGVWTGVGLLGDVLVIRVLERVDGVRWLRWSAALALAVYPSFLLVEAIPAKLGLLGVLGLLNSGVYAVLQSRLYAELPGRSGTALALSNVFGLLGALLPLGVGALAERVGLGGAMWLLLAGPVSIVILLPRNRAAHPL